MNRSSEASGEVRPSLQTKGDWDASVKNFEIGFNGASSRKAARLDLALGSLGVYNDSYWHARLCFRFSSFLVS